MQKRRNSESEYKQTGQEWEPSGQPTLVKMHDFADKQLGKIIPYGIYDNSQNQGWVRVGVDHDTAQLAVEAIRLWWQQMGQAVYPNATELLITADCGGSNSCPCTFMEMGATASGNGIRFNLAGLSFPARNQPMEQANRIVCSLKLLRTGEADP